MISQKIETIFSTIYGIGSGAGQIQAVANTKGEQADCTYDIMGNITAYRDKLGNKIRHEYDLLNHVMGVSDAEGNTAAEYTYDSLGRILQEKASDGIVTTYTYNASGLAEPATYAGYEASAMLAAGDFGNDIARLIDSYMVNEADLSVKTAEELISLFGHAFWLNSFASGFINVLRADFSVIPEEKYEVKFDKFVYYCTDRNRC